MKVAKPAAVIITAKNAAATAAKSICSALAQSAVTEVMFVDDGSTDETAAVAAASDDGSSRLKIIRLDHNRGPSHGRNLAIEASTAPFLCILDADDFMAPDRLDRLFDIGGDDWDLLADDLLFTDGPDGTNVIDRLISADFPLPCDLTLSALVTGNLPRKNRYRRELGFLKPVIRRSFLQAHGVRYDDRVRLGEDMLFYSGCLISGARFRVVPACGYYSVQSPHSLSGRHRTEDIAALYVALVEFEAGEVSQGRSVGTLPDYIRSVGRNLAVRRALDAKHKNGWRGFLDSLKADRRNAGHVIGELALGKLAALGKFW
jgi:succinoglycan biosynthesis protein ExoU